MSILCCPKAFQIIQNLQHIFEHGFDPPPFEQCLKKCGFGGGWHPLDWVTNLAVGMTRGWTGQFCNKTLPPIAMPWARLNITLT